VESSQLLTLITSPNIVIKYLLTGQAVAKQAKQQLLLAAPVPAPPIPAPPVPAFPVDVEVIELPADGSSDPLLTLLLGTSHWFQSLQIEHIYDF
jgi:hypothetical protein